ncbi:MAG: nitronate monooxygenase, partial [Thermoplasmata archaeon]
FAVLAKKMEQYGARAVELNLSCPHAKGFGSEIGSSPASVRNIVRSAVSAVAIPVLAKLTPNTSDICSLGLAAEEAGASAVVAINTLKAMEIDPHLRRPVLGNRFGGLSGPAIKPIGVRCVFELYDALSIPIIGVGGICSGIDVAEYIMAGASAVQIGSVIYEKGLEAFSLLEKELRSFMKDEGFNSISQMRGLAHES